METRDVMKLLSGVRKRGFLTKPELIIVCRWKSPRAIRHIRRNTPRRVGRITREVFATRSEEQRITLLTGLHGVGLPMASAILTLTHPSRYGVLDIRVWQLLHDTGVVKTKPGGTGFTVREWLAYLQILRKYAALHNADARDIERTLFTLHELRQRGNLYRASARNG